MLFLVLGLALLAMKFLEFGPVASWSWFVVLAPFGLAVAWWAWADSTGYTKRKAMERDLARTQARRDRIRDNIGTLRTTRRK